MNHHRLGLFEMFITALVVIGVLEMTVCLYLGITLIDRMEKTCDQMETAVAHIEVAVAELEPVEEEIVIEEAEPEVMYFDVPLDPELQDHIFAECEKYGVEPAIIVAMIERESRFKADAVGDSGRSQGLMQIQKKWHSERMEKLGCDDLLDPYQNVTVGIDFLAELIGKGRGVEWALMAYNGGPSYANKKVAAGEVSAYATEILRKLEVENSYDTYTV